MSKDYCEESVKDLIKQYIMFYRLFLHTKHSQTILHVLNDGKCNF